MEHYARHIAKHWRYKDSSLHQNDKWMLSVLTPFTYNLLYNTECTGLGRKSQNVHCRGPDSKYFSLWGSRHTVSVAVTQSLYSTEAAIDNRLINETHCVPMELYGYQNLNFIWFSYVTKFHSWLLNEKCKNICTVHTKRGGNPGLIWPVGYNLPTSQSRDTGLHI